MSSPLREAVELEMRLRGLSPKTHVSYIHALEQLWAFHRCPLETLSCAKVQAFLDDLISVRKLSWSTVNVYFSACRFLYTHVLKRKEREFSIPPRGRSGTRPGVLSQEEVRRLLDAPRALKHRAILAMTYGSGLRVSEAVRIRIRDIYRDQMMLRVEQGKGRQDRYTVLSSNGLRLLEELWRRERSTEYFFLPREGDSHYSIAGAQNIYYDALRRSGVRRVGGIHVLRHCFATHLMEAGTDVYTIRRWMGHKSLLTTGSYMHVTSWHQATVKSPLDTLKDH